MNEFKENLKKDAQRSTFEKLRYPQGPQIVGQSSKVMHNNDYFLQPERLREIFGLDKQEGEER